MLPTYAANKKPIGLIALSLACLLLIVTTVRSERQPVPDAGSGLALVRLETAAAWTDFGAADLPVYAQMPTGDAYMLLVLVSPAESAQLAQNGLYAQPIDGDPDLDTFYLAFPRLGAPQPRWHDFGQVLHQDDYQLLLKMDPDQVAPLAATGVDLAAITFDAQAWSPPVDTVAPAALDPQPIVQDMIDQVSAATVVQYNGELSGESEVTIGGEPYTMATRYTYSGTSIQKATAYVSEHLAARGLTIESHQWAGATYPNIIGEITGTTNPEDIYLITAHLDDMPPGNLAPGADDNGSGSTAVLIAADILSQYEWDCTLRFAFFTGEEQGLLGSAAYAQRAANNSENILGVLNLDMIGWNTLNSSPDIDLHARSTVPGSVALAQLFADVVTAYNLDLVPQVISNGSGASDHASFWNRGFPAILGIEDYFGPGDFNPYYHTTQDTLANLDVDYFTEFVRAGVGAFAHMSGCVVPGERGAVQGVVTDQDDQPLAGASVAFTGPGRQTFTVPTDSSGFYSINLPTATYSATASLDGYYPDSQPAVTVVADGLIVQNFSLELIVFERFLPLVSTND